MDKEEKEFREKYYDTINSVVKECVLEDGPQHGVLLVGDIESGTIKVYAMDNNIDETLAMLAYALNMLIGDKRDENTAVH
jgi:NAD(P)H-nitrite reductase large subunit